MNKLQNIFHTITGFNNSFTPMGAECEGWEEWDTNTLMEVSENLELGLINWNEAENLHNALTKFKNCDTGCGSDSDDIFNSLDEPTMSTLELMDDPSSIDTYIAIFTGVDGNGDTVPETENEAHNVTGDTVSDVVNNAMAIWGVDYDGADIILCESLAKCKMMW